MSNAERIFHMVEGVRRDAACFGVFSTGEKLAVALVLDSAELLAEVNGGYTMLEAIERLGPEWTRAAFTVQQALGPRVVREFAQRRQA